MYFCVSYSAAAVYYTFSLLDALPISGGSVTIGSDGGPYTIPSGTHTITVVADDTNNIAESDKTNNTLSQTITVSGQPLPDLIPTSPSDNSATTIFTSIPTNQGTGPTP